MKQKKFHFPFFLTVFLLLNFITVVDAPFHFPKNIQIPANIKVHFGDEWFTSTVPVKITSWFEDNWVNYTCEAGVQQLYNGSKPSKVYFNNVLQVENNAWSYQEGVVTLISSGLDVSILYEPSIVLGIRPWKIYITQNGSVGFQNDLLMKVSLHVTQGLVNSTSNLLELNSNSGRFSFNSTNSSRFTVYYTQKASHVKITGNQGRGTQIINNETLIITDAYDNVIIEWYSAYQPFLPIMFILGMIGLFASFVGPSYMVYKFQKKDFKTGVKYGVIFTGLGVALVLAWLW